MADEEGIYWVDFRVPGNWGTGMVVLKSGNIAGGDRGILYRGNYSIQDVETFTAEVQIDQWREVDGKSVLGDHDSLLLRIEGRFQIPSMPFSATIIGEDAPSMSGTLTRAGDLTHRA